MHEFQSQFDCCGTINASDWLNLEKPLPGIPISCCYETVGAVGTSNCTIESTRLHQKGCMKEFANFAKKHAAKIVGVGLSLGVIQVFFIKYNINTDILNVSYII